MDSGEIRDRLDKLAEILVLTDPTDMPALADMHTRFQEIGEWAAGGGFGRVVAGAKAAADRLEKIILEESAEPFSDLQTIGRAVSALQQAMSDGDTPDTVDWPAGLFPAEGTPSEGDAEGQALPDGLYHPGKLPAHVDVSIYAEFLARQGSVLEEMEGHILTLERSPDDNVLGALKRLLHTIKGESALLGLDDVERLCHTAEDTITEFPVSELTDCLFQLKDWLGRAFESYMGKGEGPGPAAEMLSVLEAGPSGKQGSASAAEVAAAPAAPSEVEPRPLEGDRDLLSEFVAEAREHLEAADLHLLTLETEPKNEEALNAVFRAFHTIKGVAGFLALQEVQSLAHEAENLLDRARKGELELVDAAIDITFDAVDMLKSLIQSVRTALDGDGMLAGEPALPELVREIKSIASGKVDVRQEKFELPRSAPGEKLGQILVGEGAATPEAVARALERQKCETKTKKIGEVLVGAGVVSEDTLELALEVKGADPGLGKTGEILVEMGAASAEQIDDALRTQSEMAESPKVGELLVQSGEVGAKDVAQAVRSQRMQQQPAAQVREPVKVDANRLDLLVDTIGELVIAESMVVQSTEMQSGASTELARHLSQLDKITRELQEMGTSLRMVPIRSTFQKMARLVRDLGKKSGKQVEFTTAGEDTELDKTVVDKIGDPLVHMVRNAVDHGLEGSAADRVKVGKPPVGHVELRAFHKGGCIYVEIEDDGRGLDRDRILAKAKEKGIIREGDQLTDREIWNLVFVPGFSTAQKVTDVSGRGVGMDVVKRNIEALRGQVEIQTSLGKGSVFSIRLPLTLAIIDGMVVRVGSERYIIPTLSIVMSLRPSEEQLSTVVNRGEMLKIQGRLLPLFRLVRLFGLHDAIDDMREGIVVVVEDEGRQTGILVDEILGQQQIVIKSLGEALQGIPGIAGGAIMPDGTVGLILDVGGLVRLANGAMGA